MMAWSCRFWKIEPWNSSLFPKKRSRKEQHFIAYPMGHEDWMFVFCVYFLLPGRSQLSSSRFLGKEVVEAFS
jgi:hypothetical protein